MEKHLEAGWLQRIAWSALVWVSLGLLVWVPFLYVAIRRGRGSDWGAFAAFAFYECVVFSWSLVAPEDDGSRDSVLGGVVLLSLLIATAMLLFAVFDKRHRPQDVHLASPQAPTYGYMYKQ